MDLDRVDTTVYSPFQLSLSLDCLRKSARFSTETISAIRISKHPTAACARPSNSWSPVLLDVVLVPVCCQACACHPTMVSVRVPAPVVIVAAVAVATVDAWPPVAHCTLAVAMDSSLRCCRLGRVIDRLWLAVDRGAVPVCRSATSSLLGHGDSPLAGHGGLMA